MASRICAFIIGSVVQPNVFAFDLQDEADRPHLVERSSWAESCQVKTLG